MSEDSPEALLALIPKGGVTPSQVGSRLRPALGLVHDAVDATTFLVGEGHDSTARWVTSILATIPGLAKPVRAVDAVRRVATDGVLGSVRVVNRAVEGVSSVAMDAAAFGHAPEPAVPLRSDALTTVPGALDQLVGVLNGAVGDHLSAAQNGLDLGMRMRLAQSDGWLALDADRLRRDVPDASGRVIVLVHGLATTELCWSLDAEQALGEAGHHYGGLLSEALGASSIYLRYNTGRPVADNGERLAEALEALVRSWPVPVDELVLIGHSMGGLVSRAATRTANERQHGWVERLSDLICLGSPQQGAPLARLGRHATRALQAVDLPTTRILGKVLSRRSAGVKDLGDRNLAAMGPLLDGVRYLFVAGTLTAAGEHPVVDWLGDLIVPVASASGPDGPNVTVHRLRSAPHYRLQAHPEVYRVVLVALQR